MSHVPAFNPQSQSVTALWPVLIAHPAESMEAKLAWKVLLGLVAYWWVDFSIFILVYGPQFQQVLSLMPNFTLIGPGIMGYSLVNCEN